MKQIRDTIRLTTLVAVALLVSSCSQEEVVRYGDSSATGKWVSVVLPLDVAHTEATASGASASPAISRAAAANSAQEGFTVRFGEAIAPLPATRTIAQELTNVWVLQFDQSGNNVSTTNTGSLASGDHLVVPALQVGTGYTIYVVANGMASGFTTTNPATLAAFESTMLHTSVVTSATPLSLSGKLTGASVIDLGDGNGQLKLMDGLAAVTVKRIHAEVILAVDCDVTGYTLTGAELYNVPVGATYGWNNLTTTFPANTVAANFDYTNPAAAGMASLTPTTDGTKTTYKWFMGDNRRGEVAGLTVQTDRNKTKVPAYSTFARVTLTNNTLSYREIYYDIYLGQGTVNNFDLMRNHTYTATAAINGTGEFQEALINVDGRVSSAGFTLPIALTDDIADSPFILSPKSEESSTTMIWGPDTFWGYAENVFYGKDNTYYVMLQDPIGHLAAKHCQVRGAGIGWYVPAQAELMLMWIYQPAISVADRPVNGILWSSTDYFYDYITTRGAWSVDFSIGSTGLHSKQLSNYVRCVRNP